jgi:hypothetical protein
MKNIVTLKSPRLSPLPTSITSTDIRAAALPQKIEAARRAIANCVDLAELLLYRDQAQGLAAAVKVMKYVAPEMVANANRMCKEAIVRLGELLLQYSNAHQMVTSDSVVRSDGRRFAIKPGPSARATIAKEHGISRSTMTAVARIASADRSVIERVLANDAISADAGKIAMRMPLVAQGCGAPKISDAMRSIMGGRGNAGGLSKATWMLKTIPLESFDGLMPDERKVIKARIVALRELLDEMGSLCGG